MPVGVLLSYHHSRRLDVGALAERLPPGTPIFADSGAFSAKSLGATVTVDGYCEWLQRWSDHLATYVALDVIGDPAATWANWQAMVANGFDPMPVVHAGTDPAEVDRYAAEGARYLAAGGMVASETGAVMRWSAAVLLRAREHALPVHGFGQTKNRVVRDLPWYSVDSSSWGSGHRYGTVALWDERQARLVSRPVGDRRLLGMADLIRSHGGDPANLATSGYGFAGDDKEPGQAKAERFDLLAINARAWGRLARWLERRHGRQSPPRGYDLPAGPVVFLSEAVPEHLVHAAQAIAADA